MKTDSYREPTTHGARHNKAHTTFGAPKDSENEQSTEHIDIAIIKLPQAEEPIPPSSQRVPKFTEATIRERLNFDFERNRIRILGQDYLAQYAHEGPLTELDQEDPRVFRILQHNQMIISLETEQIVNCATKVKCTTLILGIWSILQVIFSMAFAFIVAMESLASVGNLGIVLGFNLLFHLWLIKLSLNANTASSETSVDSNAVPRFYKFCGLTLFVLMLQLVITPFFKNKIIYTNIDEAAEESAQNSEKILLLVKIGYFEVWMSGFVNLLFLAIIVIYLYLFRRHIEIREVNIIQQKTLPIGYQLFANLPSNMQGISIPYLQ